MRTTERMCDAVLIPQIGERLQIGPIGFENELMRGERGQSREIPVGLVPGDQKAGRTKRTEIDAA